MKLSRIYKQVLNESTKTSFIAYHGTDYKIDKFSDSFVDGERVTQHHGSGIYFATNYENARMFGKNVYKVELSGNFINENNPSSDVDPEDLIKLMKLSDDDEWELEAQNYHPDPQVGLRIALEDALSQPNEADAFMRIQAGWYNHNGIGYIRAMSKIGIDGVIVNPPSDWVNEYHIIVFNPNAIKFIEKVSVNEDLGYEHSNTKGSEDDMYQIGMVKENDYKEYLKYSTYDDSDMAKEHLKQNINILNKLPNEITLYRVVFLKDKNSLDQNNIGSHYVLNKKDLDGSHYSDPHLNADGQPYILTVKANKNDIDFNATLKHNMQYPHEKEITLKDKGKGIKLLNIKPFETKSFDINDFGDLEDFTMFDDYDT